MDAQILPLQVANTVKTVYSEQDKADFAVLTMSRFCPRTRISTARSVANDRVAVFLVDCKSWSCPACGPRKKCTLVAKILRAKPQRFLTLTVQSPTAENGLTWTPREAFDSTRKQIPKLLQYFRRQTGRKTEYVRVLEQTQKGYPHYHFLTKGPYWPQLEIAAKWQSLTGSYIVDIQRPKRSKQTVSYVAKYVSKSTGVEFTKRRVTASRNFFKRCPVCDKPTCQCKNDDWTDWIRKKGHWQEVIEMLSERQQFVPGPTPKIWWLERREAGSEIPDDISKNFLSNQPQDEEDQC